MKRLVAMTAGLTILGAGQASPAAAIPDGVSASLSPIDCGYVVPSLTWSVQNSSEEAVAVALYVNDLLELGPGSFPPGTQDRAQHLLKRLEVGQRYTAELRVNGEKIGQRLEGVTPDCWRRNGGEVQMSVSKPTCNAGQPVVNWKVVNKRRSAARADIVFADNTPILAPTTVAPGATIRGRYNLRDALRVGDPYVIQPLFFRANDIYPPSAGTVPDCRGESSKKFAKLVRGPEIEESDANGNYVNGIGFTGIGSYGGLSSEGSLVTVDVGRWAPTPDTVKVQWYRVVDDKEVMLPGETGTTYIKTKADSGKKLFARVTPVIAGYALRSVDTPHMYS